MLDSREDIDKWLRWIGVFVLLSFGLALLGGLEWSIREKSFEAFMGFWIAQMLFCVIPGLVLGAALTLATCRHNWGISTMIAVNSVMLIAYIYGGLREAGLMP
jgi:hypothetical protein